MLGLLLAVVLGAVGLAAGDPAAIVAALAVVGWYAAVPTLYVLRTGLEVAPPVLRRRRVLGRARTVACAEVGAVRLEAGRRGRLVVSGRDGAILLRMAATGWTDQQVAQLRKALALGR